jgi:hypothetical protein
MEHSASLSTLTARARRVRNYRLLVNALAPLLTIALSILVFRWVFPWLFSQLLYVWGAAALLALVLAIPWLLVACAFAWGKIKCPSCLGPFVRKFHLWVPKTCHICGYDVTAPEARPAPGEH